MALSVNTNVGTMLALQNLGKTNASMEKTQLAITAGLRVSGPKEDASSYVITQNMRGDIAGLQLVETALANGETTVDTAITVGESRCCRAKPKLMTSKYADHDARMPTGLSTGAKCRGKSAANRITVICLGYGGYDEG